jgi:hypothetical protein
VVTALFVFFVLAVAVGVWGIVSGRARVGPRMRAVLLAAAAATPHSWLVFFAIRRGGDEGWSENVLLAVVMIFLCFMGCVFAVGFLGVPLAWMLEKTRRASSTMYVLAGASVPLVFYGLYCASGWNDEPDPFGMSLKTLFAFEGVKLALTRVIFTAVCLSMAGALAAFVYRRTLCSLERA